MERRHTSFLVTAVSLALLVIAPAAANAGWDESTAFQVTPGHTGFASGGSLERPPLQQRWSRTLGTSALSPLIAGGRVFVVSYATPGGATLHALDGVSGDTIWARSVASYGEITYDEGRVFIFERSGTVTAVSASSGETQWTRSLPESFYLNRPAAVDGVLYVVSAWSGGDVYALDEGDGSTKWTTDYNYGGNPAVDGGFVYVSDNYEGATVALSRANGRPAWWGTRDCFVSSGDAVADGARVIAPFNSNCGAVQDAASGRQLDSFSSDFPPATAGDVTVTVIGGALQARSISSGVLLWASAAGSFESPPLIVNETVYVASSTGTGTLVAVDLRTGVQQWSGALPGSGIRPGMAAGNGLLVVPAGGTVTAFESAQAPRPGLDLRITSGPDGPTTATSATLAFGSTSPAQQFCRLDRGVWTPCAGSASYLALADGPHMFEVQTRELISGSVIALATRGWSVDTKSPTARITLGPPARTKYTSVSFNLASDERPVRLDCRLDGAAWSPCATEPRYDGLADGPHRFDVRAEDALGNRQDPPATSTWTVDSRRPESTITSGPQGTTSAHSATFTFEADEPATFQCSLDNATYAPCSSPYAMSGVANGAHSLRVLATDTAGNQEALPAVRTWNVDGVPLAPETSLTAKPPLRTNATSARFSFTADANATYDCRLDGATWRPCSSPYDVTDLAVGEHVFDVRATDTAGNVDATPASWSWTVDTQPPSTTIWSGPTGSGSERSFAFGADEPATYECRMDSGAFAPCTPGKNFSGLSAGAHTFAVRATDTAGNLESGVATRPFTLSTSLPPLIPPIPLPAGKKPSAPPPAAASTAQSSADTLARQVAADTAAVLNRSSRRKIRSQSKIKLTATEAGTTKIKIVAGKGKSAFTFARAQATFTAAGTRRVRLRLTSAGRRALARKRAVKLRVRATITPKSGAAVSAEATARV